MIIDMEKYRHGHCRGGRGAAQGIATQGIAAQGIGTAAAASVPEIYPYPETRCAAPAASVLEPIPFPGEASRGEAASVLEPIPFPGGGESRGDRRETGRIYDKPHNTPRRADPITDPSLLRAVLATLRAGGKYGPRNEMIFKVGVASGRRCGDVLNLQVREVWDAAHNAVRAGIRYWDQKTRHWLAFYLDEGMRAELEAYLREADIPLADPDAYIFPSQKKGPMSVDAYGKILDKVAEKLGLQGVLHLSTHSMRKTFGYNGFRANGSEFVTDALGHYNEKNTLTYLGIDAEYLRQGYEDLCMSNLWREGR